MGLPKKKKQILFIFLNDLLQFSKSGNCRRSYLKNTKPWSLFFKFVLNKPKSPFTFIVRVVSFWLNLAKLGLK